MQKHKSSEFRLPRLEEVADVMRDGLSEHFESVDIDCMPCPDLRQFGVASAGMGGATALLEFGGEPYAHNPRYRGTNISIDDMLEASGVRGAKVFGAAMADAGAIGGNCGEMISNNDPGGANRSRVARVRADGQCVVDPYPAATCGPIANLFVSEGTPGDVIRVEVKTRKGVEFSLTQAIRGSLADYTADAGHIGMGGVFEIVAGKIRSHVMPNYECLVDGYYDTNREQVVQDFLQFYEHMGPGLLFFCALWTGDPTHGDLNLRPSGEHTHFYHRDDSIQQAGHYHGDVSPDNVHYRGYFNLASKIMRFGDIYEELGITPA